KCRTYLSAARSSWRECGPRSSPTFTAATCPATGIAAESGRPRRGRLVRRERLELHVAELDVPAFRLQADVALRHRAVVPPGGDGPVDPERHVLAAEGQLVSVPFAGLLAALRALAVDLHALQLAVGRRVAEDVAD